MNSAANQTNSFANNDEDITLITGFLKGDRVSFDRLVLKYQDQIVNLCVRIVGNYTDGEDAAQKTFAKVYKSLPTFKGKAMFSTWLYKIAVNTCKNHSRSWWNRLKGSAVKLDKPIETEEGEHAYELSDTSLSPIKDLERLQIADCVKKALKTLAGKYKKLIILRDIQGLSYDEAGTILDISIGTVKSLLFRARSALQEKLRGIFNGN